jgi:glycosyltransferase involved in cell wall biosynthesis
VVEALSRGTPTIAVRGDDNAAAEFIEEGINGFSVAAAASGETAAAIVSVNDRGRELRESTLGWFRKNAGALSLENSLAALAAAYAA